MQKALVSQWLALDPSLRYQIKNILLSTLAASAPDVRHTAALVVSKVGSIEIPASQWPEIIPTLLSNVSAQPPNNGQRQATLETLGYLCEELGDFPEDYLGQADVNAILTAVVQGMRKEETDAEVRLAATVALCDALQFASSNFENPAERNYIMQVTCEATLAHDPKLRAAAWNCLVDIAQFYYEKLPAYMTDIFALTQQAVRGDEEDVAMMALEFWCTVCEQEIERGLEADSDNHHFIDQALPQLVPLLLEQLTKQEEGADSDEGDWNVALSAGTTLGLCANCTGDAIVPLVMPFVSENINKTANPADWRVREAATFAFGSILEGPEVYTLAGLARSGLEFLLNSLSDANPAVKNTTAWTIGRILEFIHASDEDVSPPLITSDNISSVVARLVHATNDAPHVAERACYALGQLAAGFKRSSTAVAADQSLLSPYFRDIMGALFNTAARTDLDLAEQTRLQTQAFEAVNEAVRTSSDELAPLVAQIIPMILSKLQQSVLTPTPTADAAERRSEQQGLLCGVLQVIAQRLTEDATTASYLLASVDQIMEGLLAVFACYPKSVHEEAMLAAGAMTYACGKNFVKYMERFYPIMELGLQRYQDWQVCKVTVGVLGDVCRAIEDGLAPWSDRIMTQLLTNLANSEVDRSIKPQILSAFGDIALALGDSFEKYVSVVLQSLDGAINLSVQQQAVGNEDDAEYINQLRHGILEALAGLFNGFSKGNVDKYLAPMAQHLLAFVEAIAADRSKADLNVWKGAAALLGDVASGLSNVGPLFQQKQAFVQEFLSTCLQESYCEETARWATQMITKAVKAG